MKSRIACFCISLALAFGVCQTGFSKEYVIDRDHSSITFSVRHLVSKTKGAFENFEGTINFDEKDPKNATVTAKIETASVNTWMKKRDDHLRGEDFFNVSKNPTMTFSSKKIVKLKDKNKRGELVGELTLNGVTKPVVLEVVMNGKTENPFSGKETLGFSAVGTINRKDFGITWNKEGKDGNMILGDEVEINLEVEAAQKS